MKKMTSMIAAAVLTAGVGAAEFMVECENFPKPDGFAIEYMGKASQGKYLRMNKKGVSTSARTAIPEAGDYYLWVRDFTMCGNTRKAVIFLNGKKVGTFGDKKTADGKGGVWQWNRSLLKSHLEAGELEIKIVSQSEYTRFDMIILTTDPEYKPEGSVDDVAELELLD